MKTLATINYALQVGNGKVISIDWKIREELQKNDTF